MIHIPEGAVSEDVTLVFHQFNNSLLTPPSGQHFVANFTLSVYVGDVLQPTYAFLQPITFTMSYNPKNWKESSLAVNGWNGSAWSDTGISIIERNQEAYTITFTLASVGPSEFALSGTHEYIYWFPLVHK
jgi:hypothetical protein